MGAGIHGGFGATLGSTYDGGTAGGGEQSYSDRGIEIPENVKSLLGKMSNKGDYATGKKSDFSMTDVSIMSKESRVEFAKVTIGDKSYLIRGDSRGTFIPDSIMSEIKKGSGRLEFHSHPHNDDCVPSKADRLLMHKLSRATGQKTSIIVTPNGKTAIFTEHGVAEIGTVSNKMDSAHKQALIKLFGGSRND